MSETPRRTALDPVQTIRRRLERLTTASRLSLGWERLWPTLWAPLGVAVIDPFLALPSS